MTRQCRTAANKPSGAAKEARGNGPSRRGDRTLPGQAPPWPGVYSRDLSRHRQMGARSARVGIGTRAASVLATTLFNRHNGATQQYSMPARRKVGREMLQTRGAIAIYVAGRLNLPRELIAPQVCAPTRHDRQPNGGSYTVGTRECSGHGRLGIPQRGYVGVTFSHGKRRDDRHCRPPRGIRRGGDHRAALCGSAPDYRAQISQSARSCRPAQ